MPNWYATREALKRAAGIWGTDKHTTIDRLLEAASREIDHATRRRFIPFVQTRYYPWPDRNMRGDTLWLDADLISVTTLQTRAQDTTPTTISSADYYLEPVNSGPPYNRIEINAATSAAFEGGVSGQRSISVAGMWGYNNDSRAAGTVGSGLAASSSATALVCSNAALVGVGDTMLVGSEQVFVEDRSFAALGAIQTAEALTASMTDALLTVDAGHGTLAGEVIRLDSEEMYVLSVSGNDLTLLRAYNNTALAAHNADTAISINRTLTIERGVNGTTAATHADGTAMRRYVPPADITQLCIAEVIAAYHQEQSGWGREIGTGDAAREFSGRDLRRLRESVLRAYRRARMESI